jgi:hypothetical protein
MTPALASVVAAHPNRWIVSTIAAVRLWPRVERLGVAELRVKLDAVSAALARVSE